MRIHRIFQIFYYQQREKYNVAFYTQRNYLDYDAREYVDHLVDRLIRINADLHFEHRVHEAYTGIQIGEKKVLKSYVHHFGYVYTNEEERLLKHNRNGKLLELECKEHPENMRMQYQLVINQYETMEWDKAIRFAERAITYENDSEYWDACHTAILYCLMRKQDWDLLIRTGEEYLQKNLYPFDRFGVLQCLITGYWKIGELNRICEHGDEVIALYTEYKKNQSFFNQQQLMRREFIEKDRLNMMLAYMMTAGICMNDEAYIVRLVSGAMAKEVTEMLAEKTIEKWIGHQVNWYMKYKKLDI